MEFIIISGLSGAGKSSAAAFLEDLGFYCVDNMPVALITNFAGLCMAGAGTGKYGRVALVTDIRGGQTFDELFQALDGLQEMHLDYQLLFIEAADEDIVRRYKESGGGPATFSTPPGSTCPNSGGSCSACSAWGRWRRA